MLDVLAAQLAVMRAQIGGLQAQVDVMSALIDEQLAAQHQTAEPCAHLETEDAGSTLGVSRRRCVACGAVLEQELETA